MHELPSDIDCTSENSPLKLTTCQFLKASPKHAIGFITSPHHRVRLRFLVQRTWFTTPLCCTDLDFSVFCRACRQKPVIEEWLEHKGAARGRNYMDHLHARLPRPPALQTLLPGVSFVGQHISGKSEWSDSLKCLHFTMMDRLRLFYFHSGQ